MYEPTKHTQNSGEPNRWAIGLGLFCTLLIIALFASWLDGYGWR